MNSVIYIQSSNSSNKFTIFHMMKYYKSYIHTNGIPIYNHEIFVIFF